MSHILLINNMSAPHLEKGRPFEPLVNVLGRVEDSYLRVILRVYWNIFGMANNLTDDLDLRLAVGERRSILQGRPSSS